MDIVSHAIQDLIPDNKLSATAWQVYLTIASAPLEDKGGFPLHAITVPKIQEITRRSRGAVYLALRQLQRRGWIVAFKVGSENHYLLINKREMREAE